MSFDSVVSNLLVPHLPRPESGIVELARVLKPGGRLAVSMWDLPARSRLVGVMWEAITEVGAPTPPGIPRGPATFKYSDARELEGLLRSAGLDDIDVGRMEFIHRVVSLDRLWEAWTEGSVRTASAVRDQPTGIQLQIRAAFDRLARAYANDQGLDVPVSFLIASGRKR